MNRIAAPTEGEQQNPAETPVNPRPESGVGPLRTYEFGTVARSETVSVHVRVACGGGTSRPALVADVLEPHSPNPGLRVFGVVGVNAVMEICRLIQERKHLEPGQHEPVGG